MLTRSPCNSYSQRESLSLTLIPTHAQADTDLLGEREAMQRSFAEYLSERSDWSATQAAAKAKILGDRYPGVVDDFTIEEVRSQTTPRDTGCPVWLATCTYMHVAHDFGCDVGLASCMALLSPITRHLGHDRHCGWLLTERRLWRRRSDLILLCWSNSHAARLLVLQTRG